MLSESEARGAAQVEHRLHVLSIPFGVLRQARQLALPAIAVFFAAKDSWELWALWLLLPYAIAHVVRFFTLRYRLDANEFVLKSGLVFRSERHVPFARIQSLDVQQGPVHRLFGMHEVSLQSGGGAEPEARLRVVSRAALEELRERWRTARAESSSSAPRVSSDVPASVDGTTSTAPVFAASAAHCDEPSASGRTNVLALAPRELALAGLIEGRGMVVLAALLGGLWEFDSIGSRVEREVEEQLGLGTSPSHYVRSAYDSLFADGPLPVERIALAVLGVVAFFGVLRLLSMTWFMVRLWGFRLVRERGELRTEFGLATRVTAAIPLGRVQSVTVLESPLQRAFGRVSVRVETAGGAVGQTGEEQKQHAGREWIAPILRRAELVPLLRELLPEIDLDAVPWQSVDPRGARRASRRAFLVTLLVAGWLVVPLTWWAALPILLMASWNARLAHVRARRLAYGVSSGVVAQRRGWLWRSTTLARLSKIQVATLVESPFDRRYQMARVRVDTAGSPPEQHRIDVPYLARETAEALRVLLAEHAARTRFQWG